MPVHANSVIDVRLNTLDPSLYVSLTDKENQVYTAGTNGRLTECQGAFTRLNNAIVSWIDYNREERMKKFINGLYAYKVMADMFSTSSTLLTSSDSRSIYTMDGYRSRIVSDPLVYYDEYPTITFTTTSITRSVGSWIDDGFTDGMSIIISGTVSNNGTKTATTVTATTITISGGVAEGPLQFVKITGTGTVTITGVRMNQDIAKINAAISGQETPAIDSLIDGYQATIASKMHDFLFVDPPAATPQTKAQMANYIFNTLHYKEVYQVLEVGSLTVPPGV